ncbi:ApeI family dehydratase, partial [Escherichia coli]|uniref:ApeI family dehydratase n=1 Tax=Escherichia coli TaxID=562 RepID=UPI003EDE884D
NHLEIVLHLRADLFWFRGHFAVQPLLPGVAQIDWAMSYALTLLAPGWRFHSIQNIKFQSPLLPDNRVTLTLNWQENAKSQAVQMLRQYGTDDTTSGKTCA